MLVKTLFLSFLTQLIAVAIAGALPETTAAPSDVLDYVTIAKRGDVQSAFSTYSYNVVSFYADFLENKQNYIHDYQRFFITHTFSNLGTYSDAIPQLTTYTDDSFTTRLNPSLVTVLADIAPQFPWYSDWVQKNNVVASATASSNAADRNAVPVIISKSPMKLVMASFAGITALFCFSLW